MQIKSTFLSKLTSLSIAKCIFIIVLVGFTVFFNSLFNGFVLDDFPRIVNDSNIHSIRNILTFFQGSSSNPYFIDGRYIGVYYKPLMTVLFSMIYSFFGANPFYFHFVQLIFHINNTIFIFLLFLFFFSRKTSLVLSLIFLTHPINVESVSWIAASQEVLFTFFGMLALLYFVYSKKSGVWHHYVPISILLLLSLLSKETGILYVLILPVFSILFKKSGKFFALAASVISVALYLFVRFFIGTIPIPSSFILTYGELTYLEKLILLPKIILSYFQTFIFPINLISSHIWMESNLTFYDFFLPLFIDCIIFGLLLFLGTYIYLKKRQKFKMYLFFLTWFLSGLLLHLNINYLDALVADRWFYFPIIGLLGVLAVGVGCLEFSKKLYPIFQTMIILVIVALSSRTVIRNTNWMSTYSIVSHDITFQKGNRSMQYTLAVELSKKHRYKDAIRHYEYAYELSGKSKVLSDLGLVYWKTGDSRKAKETFEKLLKKDPKFALGYINYGYLMLYKKDTRKAKELAEKGVALYPNDARLLVLLSLVSYQTGNPENSVQLLEKAYRIAPDKTTKELLELMRKKRSINKYL